MNPTTDTCPICRTRPSSPAFSGCCDVQCERMYFLARIDALTRCVEALEGDLRNAGRVPCAACGDWVAAEDALRSRLPYASTREFYCSRKCLDSFETTCLTCRTPIERGVGYCSDACQRADDACERADRAHDERIERELGVVP